MLGRVRKVKKDNLESFTIDLCRQEPASVTVYPEVRTINQIPFLDPKTAVGHIRDYGFNVGFMALDNTNSKRPHNQLYRYRLFSGYAFTDRPDAKGWSRYIKHCIALDLSTIAIADYLRSKTLDTDVDLRFLAQTFFPDKSLRRNELVLSSDEKMEMSEHDLRSVVYERAKDYGIMHLAGISADSCISLPEDFVDFLDKESRFVDPQVEAAEAAQSSGSPSTDISSLANDDPLNQCPEH